MSTSIHPIICRTDQLDQVDFQKGAVLLIDKPKDWTSFDVVNKVRYKLKRLLGVKKIKVGHAGTLDPMATGLLIICTGKATKTIDEFQAQYKVYTGTFHLGATTPSFDAETEIEKRFPFNHIQPDDLDKIRPQFLGPIEQVPPMFSAIKVDGQPLYKRARKGEKVAIKSRTVEIFDLQWSQVAIPDVDFRVQCSKGTYIRSLANDIGQALESGAYLTALCRTQIGEYRLEDAWKLDRLIENLQLLQESRKTD
jgi:tRNA pseudouridine55 synthase